MPLFSVLCFVKQMTCFKFILVKIFSVILTDPSTILFYPISSTEVLCLVDVPDQEIPSIANREMPTYLKTVVAPQICTDFDRALSLIFQLCVVLFHSRNAHAT